jgi:CDP-diacylglycerol--glycerol-3-phosphate 3-phosphatidyltransferase
MTLPNWISLFRILMVAPFIVLLLREQDDLHRRGALGVFFLMAVSDFLDGWIARRWKLSSALGEILDPLADKLLITCAIIILAVPATAAARDDGTRFVIPVEVVVAILGKDVVVVVGFLIVNHLTGRKRFPARLPGKVSTASQLILVLLILIWPETPAWTDPALPVLARISGLLAVVACLDYVLFGARVLSQHDAAAADAEARP